jgi:hypothetical protein
MQRLDVDRVAEAKYRDRVDRIIARLKSLPGDVWLHFAGGAQGGESSLFEEADRLVGQICREAVRACPDPELRLLWFGSDALWKRHGDDPGVRANWEEGVFQELRRRVGYAAGDAGLDGGEKEQPGGDRPAASFHFDNADLVFLSKVAGRLALLTARPGIAPEDGKTIRRAVAALQRLPELTPEIDVQIEVAHRMGGAGFSESYSYTIKLDQRRIEIGSSGSQGDPAIGMESFSLESLAWYADGQTAHQGNRDIWLERLAYALGRDYTVKVTDESGGQRGEKA